MLGDAFGRLEMMFEHAVSIAAAFKTAVEASHLCNSRDVVDGMFFNSMRCSAVVVRRMISQWPHCTCIRCCVGGLRCALVVAVLYLPSELSMFHTMLSLPPHGPHDFHCVIVSSGSIRAFVVGRAWQTELTSLRDLRGELNI